MLNGWRVYLLSCYFEFIECYQLTTNLVKNKFILPLCCVKNIIFIFFFFKLKLKNEVMQYVINTHTVPQIL